MKKRIENPELKPYIIEFVTNTLESCELFERVFGKGFAKKSLDLNFAILFTNEVNKCTSAYYKMHELSITLCKSGKDGKLLSVEDFLNDKKLQQTVLHEAIHAILTRTKKECHKTGIASGTGILEVYYDQEELGRGFNEGYTEWICEKAGMQSSSYINQLEFIKILELAIGPEDVMKMGKGDISKNISQLLQMTAEDTRYLLSKADHLYGLEEKLNRFIFITATLEKKCNGNITEELKMDLKQIEGMSEYVKLLENPEYLNFAQDENLEPTSLKCKIAYFNNCIRRQRKLINETRLDIEDILYSKFFAKEFEEIKASGKITLEQFKKFTALNELMFHRETDDTSPVSAFKQEFIKIKELYFEQEIQSDLKKGTFTLKKFEEYKELYTNRRIFSGIRVY